MTSTTLGTRRCSFGTGPSSLENFSSFKHIKERNNHRFKNRNIYAIFKILITLGNINDWKNTDSDFFLSSEFEHRNHQILTLIIILCVTVSPFDVKYIATTLKHASDWSLCRLQDCDDKFLLFSHELNYLSYSS